MRIAALDDLAVELQTRRSTPCAAGCCGPKLMLKLRMLLFADHVPTSFSRRRPVFTRSSPSISWPRLLIAGQDVFGPSHGDMPGSSNLPVFLVSFTGSDHRFSSSVADLDKPVVGKSLRSG